MKKKTSRKNSPAGKIDNPAGIADKILSGLSCILLEMSKAPRPEKALDELAAGLEGLLGSGRMFACLYDPGECTLAPVPESGEKAPGPFSLGSDPGPSLDDTGALIDLELLEPEDPWRGLVLAGSQGAGDRKAGKPRFVLPVCLDLDKTLFGAILVCHREGEPDFSPRDRAVLELTARPAAALMERFSFDRRIKQSSFQTNLKSLELEVLQDVGIAIASTLNVRELTRILLLRTVSVMNVNHALILLRDSGQPGGIGRASMEPSRAPMTVVEKFGFDEKSPNQLGTFGGSELILENLDKLEHTIINDPALVPEALGCHKLLVSPIQSKGVLLGAIGVGNKEGRHGENPDFTGDDLGLLGAIANLAGAAISNARLYQSVLEIKNYNENILRSIANGVITNDMLGCIVSYNASAARIFGIPVEKAEKMRLKQLFTELEAPELGGNLEKLLAEGRTYQETNLRARSKTGSEVIFNLSANPLTAHEQKGKTRGMVVSVENISESARVKEMLKRYVHPIVVDMALESGQELVLGGQLREVTVLFADIRGFTSLSEQRTPGEVVEILNNFFDLMIDVVFNHNGTVDKIVGDEIMVLFGAPFSFGDDTRRAVSCALSMLEALRSFNNRRRARGEVAIEVGIGINRGPVVSGNIGSTRQMSYTVIGDAVNLASRLVDHAGPGQILISRSVREELDSVFICRKTNDRLKVKGKKKPVEVFEVLGAAGNKRDNPGHNRSGSDEPVEMAVPMEMGQELKVAERAGRLARSIGFRDETIDEMKLAVIEAVINAIEHSKSPERKVFIEFNPNRGNRRITVTIKDFGAGFDPTAVEKPEIEKKMRKGSYKRGWGLKLMHELMDEVDIRSSTAGTRVTMVKIEKEEV
ncbi:MAG: adenylate/guanylate cyclase domain-containing protein [Gemmatimonadota bacterium]|nr:adenylate/guanylate cyclase domain-containing protein [Gemmatimonadota bacterium]